MNKRTRLLVLLAVIALCFVFLWPSISWYGRTPKEVQQLALGSTENIKNYAELKAAEDVRAIKKMDLSAPLADEYKIVHGIEPNKSEFVRYKTLVTKEYHEDKEQGKVPCQPQSDPAHRVHSRDQGRYDEP